MSSDQDAFERRTFAEIGIPFPLFEGAAGCTRSYVGAGDCVACGASAEHCFSAALGAAASFLCADCGERTRLDAGDVEDDGSWECEACEASHGAVPRRDAKGRPDGFAVCYPCLRAGHLRFAIDPERRPSPEQIAELYGTPPVLTWQDGPWPFSCDAPMIFVGYRGREDFEAAAPGRGAERMREVMDFPIDGLWERLPERAGSDATISVYAYRCAHCARERARWDAP